MAKREQYEMAHKSSTPTPKADPRREVVRAFLELMPVSKPCDGKAIAGIRRGPKIWLQLSRWNGQWKHITLDQATDAVLGWLEGGAK